MAKRTTQSIEPNIADLANSWLKSYNLDYKLEQESLNTEIDKALEDYFSKNGGAGGNRPDAKLLLQNSKGKYYPILIEYKGYKDKLIKLDSSGHVENQKTQNEPNFKNINSYAVNGAVHYANAILHHTSYTDVIAIGMTGYKNEQGNIQHQIGVYYVSKKNLGAGQEVGEYTDLSFLAPNNFEAFIEHVENLCLPQKELDKLKEKKEQEITISLTKLNNDIYQKEKGLGENDRVYLVAASIIATLGVPGKVAPLEKDDLKSSTEQGNTDGDIILRKIKAFLSEKKLPQAKKDMIIRTLQNTLTSENINRVEKGESQLKRVFTKIIDDLGIYYKIGLTTDFTGKLFNEMYGWLGFSQDTLNDVVLTPSYVAKLLVKLARVDRDSYVWDFATGSAGLLVAAMNEMLIDAKKNIHSPNELAIKENKIKAEQLLGIEWLPGVYMLAILNMILMGDGSSNILNKDSLTEFDGKYGFGQTDKEFPANAFVLNPPYSAAGNGMNFVEKALGMMNRGGYAAIIIQSSAGSGKAVEYNKRILQKHTLLASIKMPIDLFIGKSSVQTHIYVFRVNEAHHKDNVVKFIDFSNDGYTRANRKKAKVSYNLRDTDHAKERYEELVHLVRFGKSKLNIFTEKEYYEGTIDPKNGADWNQSAPVDTKPTLDDFKKTVADYLAWEVSNILKQEDKWKDELGNLSEMKSDNYILNETEQDTLDEFNNTKFEAFNITDIFDIKNTHNILSSEIVANSGDIPYLCASAENNAVDCYISYNENLLEQGNCIFIGGKTFVVSYQEKDFFSNDSHNLILSLKNNLWKNKQTQLYLATCIRKSLSHKYSWGSSVSNKKIQKDIVFLPTINDKVDYDCMANLISAIKKLAIKKLLFYIKKEESEHTIRS